MQRVQLANGQPLCLGVSTAADLVAGLKVLHFTVDNQSRTEAERLHSRVTVGFPFLPCVFGENGKVAIGVNDQRVPGGNRLFPEHLAIAHHNPCVMVGKIVAVNGQHGVIFLCHAADGTHSFGGIISGQGGAELIRLSQGNIDIVNVGIIGVVGLDADGERAVIVAHAVRTVGGSFAAWQGLTKGKNGAQNQQDQPRENSFHSIRSISLLLQ